MLILRFLTVGELPLHQLERMCRVAIFAKHSSGALDNHVVHYIVRESIGDFKHYKKEKIHFEFPGKD